jgi:predicted HD phosphohydrolase
VNAPADLTTLVAMLQASALLHDESDDADVSLLEHGLQCAHRLAHERPGDLALQVAGLVHDLGWLEPDGRGGWTVDMAARHDRVAAALVEPVLGGRVAALVGGHVAAKRYLVATDPRYRDDLSERSRETLGFQGEAMAPGEVAAFDRRADRDDLLVLRRADDAAKVPGAAVPGLDAWLAALEQVAATAR